jgi:hypothetical protein
MAADDSFAWLVGVSRTLFVCVFMWFLAVFL